MFDKVALVTGGARRVGAEIARRLHQDGYRLIIHYNQSVTDVNDLINELNTIRSDSAVGVALDLQNFADYETFSEEVLGKWQRLDVLVNNAAVFPKNYLHEANESLWKDCMDINLKAPYFLAKTFAESLKIAGGNIINITDFYGVRPRSGYSIYCLSKAGLTALTHSLAQELAPEVRVNAVAPSTVVWPEGENTLTHQEKLSILEKTLVKKTGAAADVAQAVMYLVSSEFVTDEVMAVSGGKPY